ncbi:methyltransferase TYW3-domain-containing protein [Aspergillus karnatakaensis]|uniref:tRNA wybutosine-synthesizing 3 family protein n=1 Tax=Aspergillus karnatakaensis TaxID=1810916 RepID=UPI003CCCFF1C
MAIQDKTIPPIFITRKSKILADLSTPEEQYSDASPKGSVDEGIRDLIHDINVLPGLVTTSSCAGRISVFLEGRKNSDSSEGVPEGSEQRQFVASGGKGAGRWLYVSHEPLDLEGLDAGAGRKRSLHEVFGLVPGDGKPPSVDKKGRRQAPRLVRFHFEPMILHIMTATLHHAQPVLSAATTSGFRESGLQGLRCLDSEKGPSPVVAVRSAGLALESVIGYCEDSSSNEGNGLGGNEPVVKSLVSEEYLQMLVAMSNERFSVNTERKERFRTALLNGCSDNESTGSKPKGKSKPPGWEDSETRKERMRAEGLMRKKMLESQVTHNNGQGSDHEYDYGIPASLDT